MKLWIVMFLIMLLIIFGGLFIERSILKTTDHISHELDLLQEHVRANRWQEALELCRNIDQHWAEKQEFWSPFIHNQELDEAATHLARLISLLENEEKSDALVVISEIKIQLVQLHHQEVLTLRNIF